MDAARAAVQKLTGNRGHHTTVEEHVQPAVVHETIKPHRHEEATQAVDREVHQDHFHTTVQPLTHQEVLPEKHTHNILPVEHREFNHENEQQTKERIAADLAKFKDYSTTEHTTRTQAVAPTVTGEHVHHHVHETVVPVVHKETIQPEVVHTTVPIHETHHAAAQHHGLSALPMKSLDEFKQVGGSITGGHHTSREEYEGAPRPYNDKLSTTFEKLEDKFHSGHHTSSTTGDLNTQRQADSGIGGVGRGIGNDRVGNDSLTGRDNTYGNESLGSRGAGPLGTTDPVGSHGSSGTSTSKPSMMDKLNPKVDSNGDGKAGFMK